MNTATIPSSKQGSLTGAILLICGSSIGVGMLALPVLTGEAGAFPTIAVFLACCLFMSTTALLLLETCLACRQSKNLISMAKTSLNRFGQIAVLLSFLFLFYSIMTAYIAKGGELTHAILQQGSPVPLPPVLGPLLLALMSGMIIFFGPFIVDRINRFFMGGLLASYLFLMISGAPHFQLQNIAHADWTLSLFIVPFIITAFGYHNMVPSILEYLGGDRKKLLSVVFSSAAILFGVYVIWVVGLQGVIPLDLIRQSAANGEIVTQPLSAVVGSPAVGFTALYLAFFAIITSVLGQGMSILDFLADHFSIEKTAPNRLRLSLLLFVPTLIFSQTIPGVFFKALEFAGGIAAMILFGIIPALMSWVNRYRRPELSGRVQILVPGGKPMLVITIALSSIVVGYEVVKHLF